MGFGNGNEFPIGTIEMNEIRIVWKALKAPRLVILQTYGIDAHGIDTILQSPFHEGIAGSISLLGLGLVQIFVEDPELIIQRQLPASHDVL